MDEKEREQVVQDYFKEKFEEGFKNCGKKKSKKDKCKSGACGGGLGFFGFLTFLGAAIYWIGNADSFWWGVVAFLKAIVWPVFVVMEVLSRLGL